MSATEGGGGLNRWMYGVEYGIWWLEGRWEGNPITGGSSELRREGKGWSRLTWSVEAGG